MERGLERAIGLPAAVGFGLGAMVGAGVFVYAGVGARIAGPAVLAASVPLRSLALGAGILRVGLLGRALLRRSSSE